MDILSIDIETRSGADLKKSGVYRYASDPDFKILLFAYALNDLPVQVVDLTRDVLPDGIFYMLTDPAIKKCAFNANFERTCITAHFGIVCDPRQWICTMVWSTTLGFPNSLDQVAKVMQLADQKDAAGKRLIRQFSTPPFVEPETAPEKWEAFIEYCRQDVEVERAVRRKIERFPMAEWDLWSLDQKINDYGVRLDRQLVEQAIRADELNRQSLITEYVQLTGISNPNSLQMMKNWLAEQGIVVGALDKEVVKELLKTTKNETVERVLRIRQELAKTSVSKYHAMSNSIGTDDRVRGLLQFYGAGRTGRFAGRLIQVQNLPQNKLEDLDVARELLADGRFDEIDLLFGNIPDTLSQLIRTMLIPDPGCRFIVSDFSSIEARVLAWLAGEKWVMDVFDGDGRIYEATAAQMFNVPVETIRKGHANYEYRSKGKVATLACGYAGGVNALKAMGADKMGLSDVEMKDIVDKWRKANARIVKFWYDVENACKSVVVNRVPVTLQHGIRVHIKSNILFITLPSGRSLAYVRPSLSMNNYGNEQIAFMGMDSISKQWCEQYTYSGKLVENIVQAVARDCLAVSMLRLDQAGYRINLHVHDEVVLSVPCGESSIEEVERIMGVPIEWAKGLNLTAGAFECSYYKKD